MSDAYWLQEMIRKVDRKVQELEDRLYRAEQVAREALDEVDRLRSRVTTLEYER